MSIQETPRFAYKPVEVAERYNQENPNEYLKSLASMHDTMSPVALAHKLAFSTRTDVATYTIEQVRIMGDNLERFALDTASSIDLAVLKGALTSFENTGMWLDELHGVAGSVKGRLPLRSKEKTSDDMYRAIIEDKIRKLERLRHELTLTLPASRTIER